MKRLLLILIAGITVIGSEILNTNYLHAAGGGRSVGRAGGGRGGRQIYGRSQASKNDSGSKEQNASQEKSSSAERN